MAIVEDAYADNCEGAFYVDTSCISCDTCTGIAKDFFALTLDFDHAYVTQQPQNESDLLLCREALDACPVLAIGERR